MSDQKSEPSLRLSFFLWIGAAFVVLALPAFALGGVTWDELFDFEGVNGAYWHGLNTLKGLNPDLSTITYDLEYFGNATRWPTYLAWRFLSTTPWESFLGLSRTASILGSGYVGLNHLNALIFGFLGILFVGLVGNCLAGRRLAVLSSVFLLLLPAWLGHSWMNSKDIPFATSYLIYTYGSTLMLKTFAGTRDKDILNHPQLWRVVGISLLLGSRIGSIPFILISESIYFYLLRRRYLGVAPSVVVGAVLAFILTPQAWGDPFGYPLEAVGFIGGRQGSSSPIDTFNYLAFHLFESLPIVLVMGLLFSLLAFGCRGGAAKSFWYPLLLQLLIAPCLLVIGSKSIYNELRHITFIYPCLCVFSASGWLGLFEWFRCRRRQKLAGLFLALGVVFVVILALENIALAPYQYVYRSDLARLLNPGVVLHRDYWGFSVRDTTARCLKDQRCSSLIASVPYELRPGDWNQDLFDGFRELLQSPYVKTVEVDNPVLQLQISSLPDRCTSLVETKRFVLFPSPAQQLLSRVASCS